MNERINNLDGETRVLLEQIQEPLVDRKAEEIQSLDVRGLSTVTDYFVIATANSRPHLKSLGDGVERALRDAGHKTYRRAGDAESEWMVLDLVDVVIHIMTQETRDYYALEQLWSDAPRLAMEG